MNSRKLYYTPMANNKASIHPVALYDSVADEAEVRKLFETDKSIEWVEIHTRPLKKGKKSWQCQGLLLERPEKTTPTPMRMTRMST